MEEMLAMFFIHANKVDEELVTQNGKVLSLDRAGRAKARNGA
jgi:hypothetical protein